MDPEKEEERDAKIRGEARHDGLVRRRIVGAYGVASADFWRAGEAVGRVFREARELSSPERRFASDAVFELLRWRRRIEFLVGDRVEAMLDAWLEPPADAGVRIAAIADPIERLAVAASYPDWMVRRFAQDLGPAEAERLCGAMNRRAPLTVRANRIKGDREALAARLGDEGVPSEQTPIARDGLRLLTRRNVYGMRPFTDGWMELQDEASQLAAELVAPPPGGTVIDACAGAGGKALAIAALLGNRGRIEAFDVSERRLVELRKRSRRAGVTNLRARLLDGGEPPEGLAAADRVLIDAPCSGTGVIRRNPETKWRIDERDVADVVRKQAQILDRWAGLCKVGGRLIYATCALLDEENRGQVERFLGAHPEFERVPAKEILGKERALALGDGVELRLAPHVHDTDGFYAAVLRRKR